MTDRRTLTPSSPFPWQRLAQAGLIAAGLAAAANLVVYVAAGSGLGIPLAVPMSATGPAEPITPVMVILASIIPAVGATGLLAVLARFVVGPVRVFQIVAAVFLLLSLAGPALQPIALSTKLVLLTMHVVAAGATVGVLTRLTADPRDGGRV